MRAPDVAAPPRQPQPHVGHLLPPPPPPPPPPPSGAARRGGCRRRRDSDAGGRLASDSGIEQRCQPQLVVCVFFFSNSPYSIPLLHLHLPFPSMSRFRRFFSSIISPRFVELLFCRLPVSSICGRPAGLSAARKPRLSVGSFKRENQDSESKKQGDLCWIRRLWIGQSSALLILLELQWPSWLVSVLLY